MSFAIANQVVPPWKAGKIKILAITNAERYKAMPDIPTIAESAIPGFEVNTWSGALMPAGTPARVVARFNAAIASAVQQPQVRERLKTVGAEPAGGTPEQMGKFLSAEIRRWINLAKVVKFEGAN